MVFQATFNNISAISRRSVLLVGETGENHDLSQIIANHEIMLIIVLLLFAKTSFLDLFLTESVLILVRQRTDRILCSRCVSLKIMRMDGLFTLRLEFMFLIYYL